MIVYDGLWKLIEAHGVTRAWLRENKILANATYDNIQNGTGHLDGKTINRLCAVFDCQPGDIMAYKELPADKAYPKVKGASIRQRGRPVSVDINLMQLVKSDEDRQRQRALNKTTAKRR